MWPLINRWETEVDPFGELHRLNREIGRLFDGGRGQGRDYPAINVWGNADEVRVAVEAPGMDPSKIDLTVTGNTLTIEGEREAEAVGENDTIYRRERPDGRFLRTVRLPFDVNHDQIAARYENGLLNITLPRNEATKPRKIQVAS